MTNTNKNASRSFSAWIGILFLSVVLAALMNIYPRGQEILVVISQGQSASEIGRMLQVQGVIRSPFTFKIATKVMLADRAMKPGIYHLKSHMSPMEVVWRLVHRREFIKLVIPEGFNARQIAERLEAQRVTPAKEFIDYVTANRMEGYLFPTTYYLGYGMQAPMVAHLMHQQFLKMVEPEFERVPSGRLSHDQVIILASIVEREAVLANEKPMIAALYLNRLAKKIRLEADPTVQYAIDPEHWKKRLSLKDLQADSPYNTYTHFGLPPTPICSPGLASIRAVLEPAQTQALYFVANNTGGHTFNVRYDDHLKAKGKAKAERRKLHLQHAQQ